MGRRWPRRSPALVERRGHDLGRRSPSISASIPIGDMARTGQIVRPLGRAVAAHGARHWLDLDRTGLQRAVPAWPMARAYHEAGASEAQELAAVLATGVAYLRALEAHGHSLERARDALSFLLVADADEFLTVAKLRALRRLWARVEQACGLEPKPIRLHAETAWRMTTRRDPWVNMLRTTVAAFSAGIGGADAITVLPFTAALGLPDAFARRIARNTQLILLDESNLARVADPAAGAGGFEALTDALCEKAWALFQEIEREGGILESLTGGNAPGPHRHCAGAAGEGRRHPQGADHRHERVPEHRRGGGERAVPLRAARLPPLWGGDGRWRGAASDLLQALVQRPQSPCPIRQTAARRRRSPSLPCPPSARQSLSSACAIARMPISQGPAPGRRSSSPISARSRPSRPAPPSPRISSRPEE